MRAARHFVRYPLVGRLFEQLRDMDRGAIDVAGVQIPVAVDVATATPFSDRRRNPAKITQSVIHESVTTSAAATARVLRRRKVGRSQRRNVLGVHLMYPPRGGIIQHNDLIARLAHINDNNDIAIGHEVVTPYYPRHLRAGMPWSRIIQDAPWAHQGKYVVPTIAQLEALIMGLQAVWRASGQGLLAVPRAWPGLTGDRWQMRELATGDRDGGVIAHHQIGGHADGAFPGLYAYLRIERGLASRDAYETAIELATGARRWVTL